MAINKMKLICELRNVVKKHSSEWHDHLESELSDMYVAGGVEIDFLHVIADVLKEIADDGENLYKG
jgi:hypothetical protein